METGKNWGLTTAETSDAELLWSSLKRSAEIYQLHILLLQINPPIWRRLHVRSDSSIATLHELLQIAFDWSDFHLHRFVIRGKEYGLSRIGCTTLRPTRRKHFFPIPFPHQRALSLRI